MNQNSIIDLMEYSFKKNRNKIAIIDDSQQYTYCELEKVVNIVVDNIYSNNLQKKKIAICLDKSIKFITLVIAIWKTGGAYIPIDTDMPDDRMNYILQNSGTDMVIINSNKHYKFDCKMLNIDQLFVKKQKEIKLSEKKITGEDIAYIIYTSGSTGRPKGVQVSNDNLVYFMSTMKKYIKLNENDKWLSVTTVCFDISIFEMFFPIIYGITLVIGKKRMLIDMRMLKNTILNENITIMQATPVTWKLLTKFDKTITKNLIVLCGGDKLENELAKILYENSREVWNLYGPTETTIWSSVNKLETPEDISIGKPIDKTSFYLFDSNMKLNNYEGELYIGGLGVSKGYLNNKELTNERFKSNPTKKEELIYQTGDYVKHSNGKYYYIGRTDFQIKINGHRIEGEDIEKNLLEIKGIENAVVVQDKDSNNIYAFIKSKKSEMMNEEIIKEKLREKINEYMIPRRIVAIDDFPLTFNKKIDRKQLISKYIIKAKEENQNDDTYERIKQIWEKSIGEKVDIKKPYKEYPIDSLTLTEIAVEMEEIIEGCSINDIIKYESIDNIIKNKKNTQFTKYEADKRVKNLLKENKLKITDVKKIEIHQMEEMMANTYFLNKKSIIFQDIYIFKTKKWNIDKEMIKDCFFKEFLHEENLNCKYILGKKYKLQSNKFENLLGYKELYIYNKEDLNETLEYYINLVLDLNKKAIKLIIIYYEDYTFFIFKYPNVRMDEISFFKLLDKYFKKVIKNKNEVNQNIQLIKRSDVVNFTIQNEMKNICVKKANELGTELNNIVEYIIVESLKRQIKIDNINFILNTKKKFGNNISIVRN